MTSAVDATFPANNEKVDKADMRAQFLIIKNEITALQARTSVAGAQSYYGFVTTPEVSHAIASAAAGNLARDMAYGRTALTSL